MMARSMIVACANSTQETDGVSKQIREVYRIKAQSTGRELEAQSTRRVLEAQTEYQHTRFRGTKHQHERKTA